MNTTLVFIISMTCIHRLKMKERGRGGEGKVSINTSSQNPQIVIRSTFSHCRLTLLCTLPLSLPQTPSLVNLNKSLLHTRDVFTIIVNRCLELEAGMKFQFRINSCVPISFFSRFLASNFPDIFLEISLDFPFPKMVSHPRTTLSQAREYNFFIGWNKGKLCPRRTQQQQAQQAKGDEHANSVDTQIYLLQERSMHQLMK